MNNSPEVWSHYDRNKTHREQQQVVALFPLLVHQLVAYHKSGQAAAAAAAEEDDHDCDSSTASSCGEDSDDAADRHDDNPSVLPGLREWAQQQQQQLHEEHEQQQQQGRRQAAAVNAPLAGTLTLGLVLLQNGPVCDRPYRMLVIRQIGWVQCALCHHAWPV